MLKLGPTAELTPNGYSISEMHQLLQLDQEPEKVIFDWRFFLFHHPVLPLEEQLTPIDDLSAFPVIYGLKYRLTPHQDLVLLHPDFKEKRMRWFFPLTQQYWAPHTRKQEIYSCDLLPADNDVRDLRGDQRLACLCKFKL